MGGSTHARARMSRASSTPRAHFATTTMFASTAMSTSVTAATASSGARGGASTDARGRWAMPATADATAARAGRGRVGDGDARGGDGRAGRGGGDEFFIVDPSIARGRATSGGATVERWGDVETLWVGETPERVRARAE